MTAIAPLSTAEATAVMARHPDVFRPDWGRRLRLAGGFGTAALVFAYALWDLDVSWTRVMSGLWRLGDFVTFMLPPSYGGPEKLRLYLEALAETLSIAFLGTLLAAGLALPFGFLAARNVVPAWIFRFGVRRLLDTIRSVDTLIWALIWINVVGLGPFAGVLAIMSSDFGALGKLFSEAIEAADRRPVEGVESAGGHRLHAVRFGLLPQVLPVIASQVLYFFESNTRSATIIGIVGAGGIGQYLYEEIKVLEWGHVSFLIMLVLAAVFAIDLVSARIRFAVIGRRGEA